MQLFLATVSYEVKTMKITLASFDAIVANELAQRRGQTVNALLSDLLRFEGCMELCKRETQPADQSKFQTNVIYAQANQPQPA